MGTVTDQTMVDSEARRLVDLYDERVAMTAALANHTRPTGAMTRAVLDKGAELDAACEEFRRRHFPRRHKIIASLGYVMSVSRTGRNAEFIFDGTSR